MINYSYAYNIKIRTQIFIFHLKAIPANPNIGHDDGASGDFSLFVTTRALINANQIGFLIDSELRIHSLLLSTCGHCYPVSNWEAGGISRELRRLAA